MKDVSHLPSDPQHPGAVLGWGVINDSTRELLDIFSSLPEAHAEAKRLGKGYSARSGTYWPEEDKFHFLGSLLQR